jgi:hypothetical protein
MYDHEPLDLTELGWDRFVTDVWQSIFVGYRGFTGIRTLCRRWSDLLQGGLGCSPDLADALVRGEVMDVEVRTKLGSKDPMTLLAGMDEVLGDMRADLAEFSDVAPDERARLITEMDRLRSFLADNVAGDTD